MAVSPIPSDYPTLFPVATVTNAAEAIAFYKKLFGATEKMKLLAPDGSVAHAELLFGNSLLMLGEASPDQGYPATTLRLSTYVTDCDAVFKAALDAGAKKVRAPEDQFYGDRSATFVDPWGFEWTVMTHIKDMTLEEVEAEMKKLDG